MLRLALDCQRLLISTSAPAEFTGQKLQDILKKHVDDYCLEQIEQHSDDKNGQIELRVRGTESVSQEAAANFVDHARDCHDCIIWRMGDDVLIGKHERTN